MVRNSDRLVAAEKQALKCKQRITSSALITTRTSALRQFDKLSSQDELSSTQAVKTDEDRAPWQVGRSNINPETGGRSFWRHSDNKIYPYPSPGDRAWRWYKIPFDPNDVYSLPDETLYQPSLLSKFLAKRASAND